MVTISYIVSACQVTANPSSVYSRLLPHILRFVLPRVTLCVEYPIAAPFPHIEQFHPAGCLGQPTVIIPRGRLGGQQFTPVEPLASHRPGHPIITTCQCHVEHTWRAHNFLPGHCSSPLVRKWIRTIPPPRQAGARISTLMPPKYRRHPTKKRLFRIKAIIPPWTVRL